jgi:flavin-dependent dehydrogenase
MKNYRAIVIGGGPAGCAAAYTLARKSVNVTILERGQPGKDKTCGDALVPAAVEMLAHYGIDQDRLLKLGGCYFDRMQLLYGQVLLKEFNNEKNRSWVIPRSIIDQEIRRITGDSLPIQYRTAVTGLTAGSSGELKVTVQYPDGNPGEMTAEAVI